MSSRSKPVLVVVYDDGAPPSEVAVPLAEWAKCIFVVPPNEYTRKVRPLLSAFGEVVEVDTVENTAASLRQYAPDGIITYCEAMQRLTAHLAELLGLPYHSRRTAEVLTDKWQQRSALRAAGVDSVRTALIDSEADWEAAAARVGFPAVLKPVHGVASGNTFLVEDTDSGLARLRDLLALDKPGLIAGGGLVLEEYLQGRPCKPFGDYVSVEIAVRDGELIDLGVTGKLPLAPPFRETGRFWPSPFDDAENEEFFALARSAIKALDVRYGITHTELKLTAQGPRLIEVNGRLGGGIQDLALSAMGLDLVEFAARLALGDSTPPRLTEVEGVHYQIRPPSPQQPCEVLAIEGADAVRALDEVDTCRMFVKPGEALKGGVSTYELCRVNGIAADHAGLVALVDEVGALLRLKFQFEGEAEPRYVTAAELSSL